LPGTFPVCLGDGEVPPSLDDGNKHQGVTKEVHRNQHCVVRWELRKRRLGPSDRGITKKKKKEREGKIKEKG